MDLTIVSEEVRLLREKLKQAQDTAKAFQLKAREAEYTGMLKAADAIESDLNLDLTSFSEAIADTIRDHAESIREQWRMDRSCDD